MLKYSKEGYKAPSTTCTFMVTGATVANVAGKRVSHINELGYVFIENKEGKNGDW